ncbi:alpha/beta hydrolase family protein [Actinoplanes sp. NPDC051513]|uniref:alpha/beta hydrolase family protein n=1 Tax=Actinoplanes sp. NPDC051513 TaxID=3363908 RepID=UPI0037A2B116
MRRLGAVVMLVALLAGCGGSAAHAGSATRRDTAPRAPQTRFRLLHLARGDRPLPTTVCAPADGKRQPVILFSHGLGGLPSQFAPIAATWVAAGFVVVAPAYPHTNGKVKVDPGDVRHQPADAEFVLRSLARDPVMDLTHTVAIGFSAGGTTTLGLLHPGHLPGLRAAVSIAGRRPPSPFGGAPVPVLFLHGDHDPTVPIAAGRAAWAALPWPKTFVTIPGGCHGDYLNPADPAFSRADRAILDFLRVAVARNGTSYED